MSEDQLSGEIADTSAPQGKALLFPAINALFQPTAELLGEELRDRVKQKIDEKRRERVEVHAECVRETLADRKRELNTREQLELFDSWADGAGDIDPDDEIAAVWQAILADIATNKSNTRVLLDTLRSLNIDEAAFFVSFVKRGVMPFGKISDRDEHYLKALQAKGVVRRDSLAVPVILLATIVFVLGFFYVGLESSTIMNPSMLLTTVVVVVAWTLMLCALFWRRRRLTWLGRELADRLKTGPPP